MQKSNRRQPTNRTTPQLRHLFLAMLILACISEPAAAHAVLVESSPAPESTSSGPNIAIRLRFNVRIDADHSRITIISSDGSGRKLETLKGPEPNTLSAAATGLQGGAYRIRWQVLASDGHLTSGEIPFYVGG